MKKTFLLLAAAFLLQNCGPSAAEIELKKRYKEELIGLKAKLAGAETRLESIKEYQLVRTAAEKAAQVEYQTKVVLELKSKIRDAEIKILE